MDARRRIPDCGITGIFGPSGSGKTTLLRTIAGLDRHPGTLVEFQGDSYQSGSHFVPPHRRPFAYVFQEPRLFSHLNVRQNISYAERRARRSHRFGRKTGSQGKLMEQAIQLFGLRERLSARPDQLSGGEAQRVAIVRALAARPRLLLMDEPLSSLDRGIKQEILPYLRTLSRSLDLPIVYVSHDLRELSQLCDHLIWLRQGRVMAEDKIERLLIDPRFFSEQGEDACFLLTMRVARVEAEYGLTHLKGDAGSIHVPSRRFALGDEIRLLVFARDVSLCLSPPKESSIRNVLPTRVQEIHRHGSGLASVLLEEGMLARITRKSLRELDLQAGKPVYAQIKSVAVLA